MNTYKDTDIYARVTQKDRHVTIDLGATTDDKAVDISEHRLEPDTDAVAETFTELVDQTDVWLLCADRYFEDNVQYTLVPTDRAEFGVQSNTVRLTNERENVTVSGYREGLGFRYASYATAINSGVVTEQLSVDEDPADVDYRIQDGFDPEQFVPDADEIHEISNRRSEWIVAYNRSDRATESGAGYPHDFEVFIPIEDFDVEDDQSHREYGIGIDLPDTARTAWDGPDNIGQYGAQVTEFRLASEDEVPEE